MHIPEREKLIRLGEVSSLPWLPERHVHLATIYRWVTRGVRGHKLRVLRVGGGLATTETWLLEFFQSITARSATTTGTTSRHRTKAVETASLELEEAGI